MKADSYKISKVFSGGGDVHYVLPHFQREYRWSQEDWQALLDDVLATYEAMPDVTPGAPTPEHFLGSLVVVEDGTQDMVSIFKLVDGQQRLTSLSLLLCALGRAQWPGHAELPRNIRKYLLNADQREDLRFKLLPTTKNGDREAYASILEGTPVPDCRSLIPRAYTFFEKKLHDEFNKGRDRDILLKVLLNAFQVVFINLNRDENPYRIFESLNARGKPLGQADLVRNYIAMRLPSSQQQKVFDAHWSPIEAMLSDQREVGRLGELSAFLRHYDALYKRSLGSEKHIYARFRDAMEDRPDDADFVNELQRLRRFAGFYNSFLRPDTMADAALRQAIERLRALDLSTIYPFLLAVFHAHNQKSITTAQVIEVCIVLENFLIRRLLLGTSTNDINSMAPRLWSDLDLDDLISSLQATLSLPLPQQPSPAHIAAPDQDLRG